MGLKNLIKNILLPVSISAILNGCSPSPYSPNSKVVFSHYVDKMGALFEVSDTNSSLQGTKIRIPFGSLDSSQKISIGEINNPPEYREAGMTYISGIDLGPNKLKFNLPVTIKIHYGDELLSDAGISDESDLRIFGYNSSNHWEEIKTVLRDPVGNNIQFSTNHFSYYAITCFDGMPPEDLGTPQPGDLLYNLGSIFGDRDTNGWRPGHVGIYVGDKVHDGVHYNVIEALEDGITRKFYDPISDFGRGFGYMGAREPKNYTLTSEQREQIVEFAEAQIGKPYALFETTFGALFGMARGSLVKGPERFNCVGFAEAAYEYAGVNGGEGLTTNWQEEYGLHPALTPAEHYNSTKPAKGKLENTLNNQDESNNSEDFESYGFSNDSDKVMGMINGNKTPSSDQSNNIQETPQISSEEKIPKKEDVISSNKSILGNYLFQENELKKTLVLNNDWQGLYNNLPNPLIKNKISNEEKRKLGSMNIEDVINGEYTTGSKNIHLLVLGFDKKISLEDYLELKEGDLKYCPIFTEDKVLSIITPNIDETLDPFSDFNRKQKKIYSDLIFDYARRTGMKIQICGVDKSESERLLNLIDKYRKENWNQ